MKKYWMIIAILGSVLVFSACSTGNQKTASSSASAKENTINNTAKNTLLTTMRDASPSKYKFVKKVYKKDDIKIAYPQISGEKSDLTKAINQRIRQDAMSMLAVYDKDQYVNLGLDEDYKFELKNDSIISIGFTGLGYVKGTAHPNNLFCTSNIDVQTGKEINITDMFVLNTELAKTVKEQAQYVPICDESNKINKELASDVASEIEAYESSHMVADLKHYNGWYDGVEFYFTKNKMGFSFPVSHTFGDYANLEVSYDTLKTYMKSW